MATKSENAALRQLDVLMTMGALGELTDGQLLERFTTGRGEPAEHAFAALIERHGAMVLRVCRARLRNADETDDAFQATFLVLVRKARALWVQDSLGPWLHRVAVRTSSCARRAAAARRRVHAVSASRASEALDDPFDDSAYEEAQILHEEIDRLPERYRVPIVLCDLEGKTCEEAARRLGCPVGTVKSWRARGRARLRQRLVRAGVAPAVALAWSAGETALGCAPRFTASATAQATMQALADRLRAGEVPASVLELVQGVLTTMLLGKIRVAAAAAVGLIFLAAGLGALAQAPPRDKPDAQRAVPAAVPNPPQAEVAKAPIEKPDNRKWMLTLREAIEIGLAHGQGYRLRTPRAGDRETRLVIEPEGNADRVKLKTELMADVRSIHEAYWNVYRSSLANSAEEKLVQLVKDVRSHEQSELEVGRGTQADVAEATQRLEQVQLDVFTGISDINTTEQRLRQLLNVAPVDGQRIVPTTEPTESKITPEWTECQRVMQVKLPALVAAAARLKDARSSTVRQSRRDREAELEIRTNAYDQTLRTSTQVLARCLLEVNASYNQLTTASRLRSSAANRLDAQRAFYEEGRITIDRYLDAATQHASAVAQEARFKAAYNTAIVALEEAKGTLLAYSDIDVADEPRAPSAAPSTHAPAGLPAPAPNAAASAPGTGKTFSFQLTLGLGGQPIEVRGSLTVPGEPAAANRRDP